MRRVTNEDKKLLNNINRRLKNLMKKAEKAELDINLPTRNISSFNTRKEFNKYISQANKILKSPNYQLTTNKYGFTYSKSDKDLLEKSLKERNIIRKKQWDAIKNVPISTAGITFDITIEKMSQMAKDSKYESFNPRHRDIKKIKSRAEFEKYINILKKEASGEYYSEQNKKFKENYIKSLNTVWGADNKISDIIEKIKNMSDAEFMKYYYSDDYVSPSFIYMTFLDEDKRYATVVNTFG